MIAEHCEAEEVRLVSSGENEVNEWSVKPTRTDNHFFDTLVYNFACASTLGIRVDGDDRKRRIRR